MEQIPMEVIEMADDFYQHLSQEEFTKIINEYANEQQIISLFFMEELKEMNDEKIYKQCLYLLFIICHSYRYYHVKLRPLDKEIVYKTKSDFMNYVTKARGTVTTNEKLSLDIKVLVSQDALIDFMILKMFGTDENPIIFKNEKHWFRVYLAVFSILLNINNEMKKQLLKDIN